MKRSFAMAPITTKEADSDLTALQHQSRIRNPYRLSGLFSSRSLTLRRDRLSGIPPMNVRVERLLFSAIRCYASFSVVWQGDWD